MNRRLATLGFLLSAGLVCGGGLRDAGAACDRAGGTVTCRDVDLDGFITNDTVMLRILAGAEVRNIARGGRTGTCLNDPLSLPAVIVGRGSTVVNQGLVTALGVCGWGVLAGVGSAVSNEGQVFTLDSTGHGLIADDGSRVINVGQIDTQGQGSLGILAGSDVSVLNDARGQIVTRGGGATAIDVFARSVVENRALLQTTGAFAHGIDARDGAQLTNSGAIRVDGAGAFGIRALGGNLAVVNAGTITAVYDGATPTTLRGAGVLAVGTTVSVTNTGLITGSYTGLQVTAFEQATIANAGVIRAIGEREPQGQLRPGAAAVRVSSNPGSLTQFTNSGQLLGMNGSTAFRGGGSNDVLMSSGLILGDIDLDAGDDTLNLVSGADIDGTVSGGPGLDFLVLGGRGRLAGSLSGFEGLTKSGADVFRLTGSARIDGDGTILDGGVRVEEGAVLTANRLFVSSGASLAGAGVVMARVQNNGVLAPAGLDVGPSDGFTTMTISGGFTQMSMGTLQLRLGAGGASDRLDVRGFAHLDGTLAVALEQLPRDGELSYLILAAVAGTEVRGSFARLEGLSGPFLRSTVALEPAGVMLRVARMPYASAAVTRNQAAVAAVLDRARGAAAVQPLAAQLDNGDLAGARAVFDALAPAALPTTLTLSAYAVENFQDAVWTRNAAPQIRAGFWLEAETAGGRSRRHDADQFRSDATTWQGGVDARFSTTVSAGLAVAHSRAAAHFAAAHSRVQLTQAMLAGTYTADFARLTLGLGYGGGRVRLQRTDALRPAAVAAGAGLTTWGALIDGRTDLAAGQFRITPHLGLRATRVRIGGVAENAVFGIRSSAARHHQVRAHLGAEVRLVLGAWSTLAGAAWSHDFAGDDAIVPAAIASLPDSGFLIAGERGRRTRWLLNGAIEYALGSAARLRGAVRHSPSDDLAGTKWTIGFALPL